MFQLVIEINFYVSNLDETGHLKMVLPILS